MTPTRIRGLVVLGAACAALTWLLLIPLYASLPPLPWTPVLTLLVLAALEGRAGYLVKHRLTGRGSNRQDDDAATASAAPPPRPLHPIAVARTAAIAKASALAAAVIGGISAGFVLDLARSLGQPTPRDDTLTALGYLAVAVILAAAAVHLERSCRVPPGAGGPGRRRA